MALKSNNKFRASVLSTVSLRSETNGVMLEDDKVIEILAKESSMQVMFRFKR